MCNNISISFVSGIYYSEHNNTIPLIGCSKDVGEVGEVGRCPYDNRFTGINGNVGGVLNYHRHKRRPVQLCKKYRGTSCNRNFELIATKIMNEG